MELDLTAAWKFSRLLREQQPDTVHAHAVTMTALAISLPEKPNPLGSSRRAG